MRILVFLITSSIALSFSASAHEAHLNLDASCKMTCALSEGNKVSVVYADFVARKRSEIEAMAAQVCSRKFSPDAFTSDVDCRFFKH